MINDQLIKRINSLAPGMALLFKYSGEDYRIWKDNCDTDSIYGLNILKMTSFGSTIGNRTAFKFPPSKLSIECIQEYVNLLNIAEILGN